jgi:integrase
MTIYKKNGHYYCRGRVNGERYNKACKDARTIQEARKKEEEIRYKIKLKQSGFIKENRVYSVFFMVKLYLNACKNNATYNVAKIFSKRIISFFGLYRNICTIKPSDIISFRNHLLNIGLSKATVNRHFTAIKRAYNLMIKDGLIDYNPTNSIDKFKEDGRRNRYLSKEEWKRLYKVMPPYLRAIVTVALLSGLRKQNVLRLRWEQINFDSRTIELLKSENKGKKHIYKPISNSLYRLLLSLNPKQSGYVFINPKTNKPYTDVKKSFKTALKKANIEGVIFHDLRRTFGTWLLKEGVDIRTVQYLLDHEDISTTQRYLSLSTEYSIAAINKLDNYM